MSEEARQRLKLRQRQIQLQGQNPARQRATKTVAPPIPQPVKPPLAPNLETFGRPAYRGAGATIGGLGGTLGGPLGVVGGGVLGDVAGSMVYDAKTNLFDALHGAKPKIGAEETIKSAGPGAKEEAMYGMAFPAAGQTIKNTLPLLGKFLGVRNPMTKEAMKKAEQFGIGLGPTHMTQSRVVRAYPKVIGVFPWVGAPYKKNQARVVGEMDAAQAKLLNELAPNYTRGELGETLVKKAGTRFKAANRIASHLYKRFEDVTNSIAPSGYDPNILDTSAIKGVVSELGEREGVRKITLESGEALQQFGNDRIGEWLKQLDDLPELITVEQARGLEAQFNDIYGEALKNGWDMKRIGQLKSALETVKDSINVSNLPPDMGEEILSSWKTANDWFSKSRKIFETPTAGRFGSVDRNLLKKGGKKWRAAAINQDEVFDKVFRAKSPQALRDLRSLVGNREFRASGRKYIEDQARKARVPSKEGSLMPDLFSAADFEKRMGLDTPEGWETMDEILKGSGVTSKMWQDFLDTAKQATDIAIRDPSTFLERHMIFSGGLGTGVIMGAGAVNLPTAIGIVLTANRVSQGLMSPRMLKAMTQAIDPKATDVARHAVIGRILKPEAETKTRQDFTARVSEPPLLSLER